MILNILFFNYHKHIFNRKGFDNLNNITISSKTQKLIMQFFLKTSIPKILKENTTTN
jgi:hypothetical protein